MNRPPQGGGGAAGTTCSNNVASWTTPSAGSCTSFSAGNSYSYPSDFGTVLNKVAVYECPTSGKRIIMSNGIPDHEITQGNPNSPCETNWFVSMPLNPVKTTTAMEPAALGIVAMSLNGVPAYGAQEGGGTNAAEPAAGAQITDAQYWYGHAAMQGDHHYHNPNLGHSTMPSESTLMGYALDGFPIYGAVADDSVLDQCNGQTVQGSYQYHVKTLDQVDGSGSYCSGSSPAVNWKYVSGCYYGTTAETIVGDGTTSSLPSDCTLVSGSAFTPTAPTSNNTVLIIAIVAAVVLAAVPAFVLGRRRLAARARENEASSSAV